MADKLYTQEEVDKLLREARIDELENLYLSNVHFGCDKNDEEFVTGSDPKDPTPRIVLGSFNAG